MVKYLCARGAEKHPVDLVCRVLGIAKSTYYARKKAPKTAREKQNEKMGEAVERLFGENRREYGRRRLCRAMRQAGYAVGERQVSKLMKERCLVAKGRKKYRATTNSKHRYPTAANLLDQEFGSAQPNEKWCGDSTYIATDEGWLYAAGIIDLCDRSCVGLSFSGRHTQELMLEALDSAKKRHRPKKGLVFHSDRGVQYAATAYRKRLERYRMKQSMSRSGNPYDNAAMESFWATVKRGVVEGTRFRTREEAKQAIFEYVFGYYNTHRLHSMIGYRSPTDYRNMLLSAA